MKKKINIRLVGIAILAMLLSTITIIICNYSLFQKQIKTDLGVCAKLLKETHYFESEDIISQEIDLSTDLEELRVTWISSDGAVLYDNDAGTDNLTNHKDRPEVSSAFEAGEGESVRKSDTMNKNTFYYAVLLDNGTVLRVSTEAQSIWSVFFASTPVILIVLFVIILVCVAISHFLTRQLINPIEEMARHLEDTRLDPPYKELTPFANQIRAQHADILSSAKMRQDFTANVSHELKTPLTAISGYAELLENDMVSDDNKHHFYQEIKRNADRLVTLINDIIRLSELDRSEKRPEFEKIDLFEVASQQMEALLINAKKRNIEIIFQGEHTTLTANSQMIAELIDNLVQNAIRYNNDGGKVWVTVTSQDGATIIVRDNGIGIPKDERQRVFERFYRVDKSRSKATGGTGLGLAIVKHIVELHDGNIELTSKVGEGTTVKVVF
ncbi:MAG: ATP-binding protein [Pseudobutyrivibrio sp.]|nr:ATP-binding protein [Pseudobutyrivibrio sp.]